MAGFCRKTSQSPRFSDRPVWVETTHQPVAAFGKRTFNVGFPAVSSKSCRSPPDPNLTLSVSQEPTLLRMKRTYRLQRVFGYLRS